MWTIGYAENRLESDTPKPDVFVLRFLLSSPNVTEISDIFLRKLFSIISENNRVRTKDDFYSRLFILFGTIFGVLNKFVKKLSLSGKQSGCQQI